MMWRNTDRTAGPGADYYSVHALIHSKYGMQALRELFPEAKADELNFVMFSTSGIHGTYCKIEDVEESWKAGHAGEEVRRLVTFLIVQPRMVALRYGLCEPTCVEDFEFLKRLRDSSLDAQILIAELSGKKL